MLLLQQRVPAKHHFMQLRMQGFLDQRGEDYDDCRGLPALVSQLQLRAMTSSRNDTDLSNEQMLCVWNAECMGQGPQNALFRAVKCICDCFIALLCQLHVMQVAPLPCRSLELRSAKPTLQFLPSSPMQELAPRRCELLLLASA